MSEIKLIRRSEKLLYPLSKGKRCCCECCLYDGECLKRNATPDGECDSPFDATTFRGTITVAWCGLSFEFSMADRPAQPNFAIGVGPVDSGYEQDCGEILWNGNMEPVRYKYEKKSLLILGGGYIPANGYGPPNASPECLRIWFPIVTLLQGVLVIYPGGQEFAFAFASADQENFVFTQDVCRRNTLWRVPGGGNDCNNDPNHLHCRVDPTVTVNEAP